MLTECGGIAYLKCPQAGVAKIWGYLIVQSAEEFRQRYHALMDVVNTTALFSGFCYTQFADTFQEANGLLCADRTPKLPIADIAAATRIGSTHIPGTV
jgi:hypothetical protein